MLLGGVLAVLAALALWGGWRLRCMDTKEKKALFKGKINNVFTWAEDHGLLGPTPAFIHDYHQIYPKLKRLEAGYEDVRSECLELLQMKERLVPMSALGGAYTQAGIHVIEWKTFMFKSGSFIEPNCARAPHTAALLRQIPGLYTAFFSILEPHQYVTPHWGYYKGFLRYHLGVVIPRNNADGACWLRVNADPAANARRDSSAIAQGEKYHWRNGAGIAFNDNYLHDACNDSDEIRVVLWLDLRRPMPWYLQLFNMLCLALVYRERSVRRIRENSLIGD